MSNSKTDTTTGATPTGSARPHRRLSLTLPTVALADNAITEPAPIHEALPTLPASSTSDTFTTDNATVRVMAYLTEEESQLLEELWLQMRRRQIRPSKSDVLRAALSIAAAHPQELTDVLSQQQISTSSRQRLSKVKK